MYDVMDGIRVVEVAEHTFVPAASMILADWGADVIKVEKVAGGDAARSMRVVQVPGVRSNPFFEAANRGKRSVALDLTEEEGRHLLYRLIDTADVFITNMRDGARAKLGIEPSDLLARRPGLVYALGTAYGRRGPLAPSRGFDFTSSWCRSGAGFAQTGADGAPPPVQPGSVGDLTGGAELAGAIAAALLRRERTGRGGLVEHSLYLTGIYIMSQAVIGAGMGWERPQPGARTSGDPLTLLYRTKDDRWLALCLLYDEWWPDFARRLGHPEWLDEPRYADGAARFQERSGAHRRAGCHLRDADSRRVGTRPGRSRGRLGPAEEPGRSGERRPGRGQRLCVGRRAA